MKRMQRAIRPVTLAACGLVYLVFILQFAQYNYRVYRLRAILEDVQTLEVDKSTYSDAARVAGLHLHYLIPNSECSSNDCTWSMRTYEMPFREFVFIKCSEESLICPLVDSLSDSRILNGLGLRRSEAFAEIEVHQGTVKSVTESLGLEGLSHKYLMTTWTFLPESPEPWMDDWQKSYYSRTDEETPGIRSSSAHLHMGYHGGEVFRWLITPSTPQSLRHKACEVDWNCWGGLRNCLEFVDLSRRADRYVSFGFPYRVLPTPNATIFFMGIFEIVLGALVLGLSWAFSKRPKGRGFLLSSLGIVLIVLGGTAVYITAVADDVSFWVWLAAALIYIVVAWAKPLKGTPRFMRVLVYSSVAIFSGSLIGGLVDAEDYAGLLVFGAVAVLWILTTRLVAVTKLKRGFRATLNLGAAVFGTSLYLVSRLETASFDDLHLANLRMPFQQSLPLPEWFARFDLDIWLKVALITAFLLVGLLSAAFFIMHALHSRRHAQMPAS